MSALAAERSGRWLERGRLDAVIAGLLFMAGMRRSEVSARRWADVADAADGDGVLVTVRRSKTNQEDEVRDVRFREGRRRPRDPDRSRGLPARCSVLSVSPLLRELVLARSERKVRLAGKARRGADGASATARLPRGRRSSEPWSWEFRGAWS